VKKLKADSDDDNPKTKLVTTADEARRLAIDYAEMLDGLVQLARDNELNPADHLSLSNDYADMLECKERIDAALIELGDIITEPMEEAA
jgi:hypothetical protein